MSPIHTSRHKAVLLAAGATVLIFIGFVAGFVLLLSGAYSEREQITWTPAIA
jgi:hypothetical protein